LTWAAAMSRPALGLWLLLSHPMLDADHEHNPQHFWLVPAATAMAIAMGVPFRAVRPSQEG
jgi:hypothetical protein